MRWVTKLGTRLIAGVCASYCVSAFRFFVERCFGKLCSSLLRISALELIMIINYKILHVCYFCQPFLSYLSIFPRSKWLQQKRIDMTVSN